MNMDYLERIRIDLAVRSGKPTVRGTRITVHDILEYLGPGMSREEILADFPDLSPETIRATQLFDENLSFRLVRELADVYPGPAHVRDAGLRAAEDQRSFPHLPRLTPPIYNPLYERPNTVPHKTARKGLCPRGVATSAFESVRRLW